MNTVREMSGKCQGISKKPVAMNPVQCICHFVLYTDHGSRGYFGVWCRSCLIILYASFSSQLGRYAYHWDSEGIGVFAEFPMNSTRRWTLLNVTCTNASRLCELVHYNFVNGAHRCNDTGKLLGIYACWIYCSGSLEPETLWSRSIRPSSSGIWRCPWRLTFLTFTDILTPEDASVPVSDILVTIGPFPRPLQYQRSASLAFCEGIHQLTENSRYEWPVRLNRFIVMTS